MADSEKLPTRTHRSADVLKSPGGDGDGEIITGETKKKTRKEKKEKKKVKDKDRIVRFCNVVEGFSFSLVKVRFGMQCNKEFVKLQRHRMSILRHISPI